MAKSADQLCTSPQHNGAYADGLALQQLWLFWIAPIAGGMAGGAIARWMQLQAAARESARGG